MKNKRKEKVVTFVQHPRYGANPIPSGVKVTADEIERSHWRYKHETYFPDTAIMADVTKQNYCIYPRKMYVDIAEVCNVCHRPFIFFAKEQQYWFEELGFWIDAHCTRCIDCRKKDQEIRFMQKRYQSLIGIEPRTEQQNKELKEIAMELYQLGYIRDIQKIQPK
jgi:hypothetical protein